jgi:2'-5' RNA ligase
MGKIRTFVAAEISGAALGLAAKKIKQLSPIAGDYRWEEPENMHLTLNFLGDIQEKEIPDVCMHVKRAVAGVNEFAIEFGGLGAFPRAERPRVLWLGVEDGRDKLLALQAALTKRLDDEMGFPPDRNDFCPHLTLGRANRSSAWSGELLGLLNDDSRPETATSFVDEVIVFSSYMERGRPTYTPMSTIELG